MNELTVTEYKDIRVLTTQQISEAYGNLPVKFCMDENDMVPCIYIGRQDTMWDDTSVTIKDVRVGHAGADDTVDTYKDWSVSVVDNDDDIYVSHEVLTPHMNSGLQSQLNNLFNISSMVQVDNSFVDYFDIDTEEIEFTVSGGYLVVGNLAVVNIQIDNPNCVAIRTISLIGLPQSLTTISYLNVYSPDSSNIDAYVDEGSSLYITGNDFTDECICISGTYICQSQE